MENRRLKACLWEIEHVMKKHGIGGYIILADRDGGEFKYINPHWSVFTGELKEGGRGVFRARAANPDGTRDTIHLLQVVQDAAGRAFLLTDKMLEDLKNHIPFEGGPRLLED